MANILPVVHQSCLVLCVVNICQKFDISKCLIDDRTDTGTRSLQLFGANSVHNLAFSSSHTSEASNHLMQILTTIWPSYPPTELPGSFACISYDQENFEEEKFS